MISRVLALGLAVPLLIGAAPQSGQVTATVSGLRSTKGQVVACLTAQAKGFPECQKDPAARAIKVPAATSVELDFGDVPAGRYAISLFHDENGDGRLNKSLMLPAEGYGFSRDAPVRMGPPSFAKAAFDVAGGHQHQAIKMRYLF